MLSIVYAGGMQIKSGLWETKSFVTLPFDGGVQESTSQDCIDDSNITPEEMMKDAQGCNILESDVDKNSMTWTISCKNNGVEMIGKGHANSDGNTVSGGMNISATVNEQDVTMSTKWEGKYIGACN